MCAIGGAVEKQIGQWIARQVKCIMLFRRKNEARARNAVLFGEIGQARFRLCGGVDQPKNAVRNPLQDIEPAFDAEF